MTTSVFPLRFGHTVKEGEEMEGWGSSVCFVGHLSLSRMDKRRVVPVNILVKVKGREPIRRFFAPSFLF